MLATVQSQLIYFVGWITQWMNRLLTDTDKLMVILEENNDIVDSLDAEELLDCKGHIEFRNGEDCHGNISETQLRPFGGYLVTFMYDESKGNKGNKEPRKALDSVSFTVEPGQHVALVGETGAGKSTTFSMLPSEHPRQAWSDVSFYNIRAFVSLLRATARQYSR